MEETSTATSSERPTFAEVFASDSAPVAESLTAAQESTDAPATATASVDATVPPVTTAPGDVTPVEGPIPYKRHKEVVDTAWAARDALQKQVDSLGWAQSVDRGAVEEAHRIGKLYQTDRAGYLRQVMAEAMSDPDLAPLVRSEAARTLASRQQPQANDLEPDIPVLDERGQVVSQAYSADRVRKLIAQSVRDAISKEVAPMREDFQTRQAREKADAEQRQSAADLKSGFDELVETLPGFQEHNAAIAKAMESIPGDPFKAARKAWHQVVGSKLSNADQTRAKQLDDFKTRAAASTVNPAGAAVATTKRPTSFHDPSLTW